MQFLRRDFIVGILLYTLLFFGITAFFFSQFYQDPYVFFNQTGDGIKNNSTFLYHVLHDNSWWHHQEMNYPFGENILFTDCQPLLANTVKFLVNSFPFLKNHVQAIYNINLFFVWFLGGLALLQLFYKMGIHSVLSAVLAISCILMNPQINRLLCGHHALSYPLLPFLFLWWYNILHLKKDTIFNLAKIILLMVVLAFTHLYLFAFGALICFVFICFYVWQLPDIQPKIYGALKHLGFQIILPLCLVYVATQLANPVSDRPEAPSRFFVDDAGFASIFLHPKYYLSTIIYNWFGTQADPNHEVHAYAGILALPFFLMFSFGLLSFGKFKKLNQFVNLNSYQIALITIAIAGFLIAIGFPFTVPGFQQGLYNFGIFRQLRSIGRFAVVFYFAIQILSITWVFSFFKSIQKIWTKNLLIFLFTSVLVLDMFFFLKAAAFYPKSDPEFLTVESKFIPGTNLLISDYQAIITNPFFHVGSENSMFFDKKDALKQSLQLSVQTGLPLINSMLSRNSLKQTIVCTQLAHPLYKLPEILNYLPNKKPLLLLESKGYLGESNYNLNAISNWSFVVYENESICLKAVDLNGISELYAKKIRDLQHDFHFEYFSTPFYFYKDRRTYGEKSVKNKYRFILSDTLNHAVVLTCRFKTLNIGSHLIITELDKKNKELSSFKEYTGDWIEQIDSSQTMIAIPLNLHKNTKFLKIELKNTEFNLAFNLINAMLYPGKTRHFFYDENCWYYNNYQLGKEFE
jgi:Ca2+/Na+ antiporter